jgi:DNA polymerase-3 subunit alpha
LNNIDVILSFANRTQKDSKSGQVDLFGDAKSKTHMAPKISWIDNIVQFTLSEQLGWERDLLGLYLSHHPLESYAEYLANNTIPINELTTTVHKNTVVVGGAITMAREITTKNGSKMAFVKLADMNSEIELVIFPKIYKQGADLWKRDQVILVQGKLSTGRGTDAVDSELKLLVDQAAILDLNNPPVFDNSNDITASSYRHKSAAYELKNNPAVVIPAKRRLYIRLEDSNNHNLLMTLKEKIENHTGETEVVLVTGPSSTKQIIKLPQTIKINEESIRDLAEVFGALNVVVK